MIEDWKIDKNFREKFIQAVQKAFSTDLKDFRRDPYICTVIENSTQAGAMVDIEYINKNYRYLWNYVEKYRTSDKVGNPDIFYFEKIGNFSPSTIRYIKALGDVEKYFCGLEGSHIAEIGPGYGGFAKIIHDKIMPNPVKYTCFDLIDCFEMQGKFLNKFNIHPTFGRIDDLRPPNCFDLIIASCSWSELELPLRVKYIDNVISRARNGYFILNYDTEENIQLLKEKLPGKEFIQDTDNPCIFIFR